MENTNEKTVAGNVLFIKEAKEALLQLESSQVRKNELDLQEKKQAKALCSTSLVDILIQLKLQRLA